MLHCKGLHTPFSSAVRVGEFFREGLWFCWMLIGWSLRGLLGFGHQAGGRTSSERVTLDDDQDDRTSSPRGFF